MSTRFNHLNFPNHWEHYWSKYPQGYTILEALLNWVNQVDNMVDNVNDWNIRLDDFIQTFDNSLQGTVDTILGEWQNSGFLEIVLADAIQTEVDDLSLKVDTIVTVGANGDFTTLNEAITHLSNKNTLYTQGGYRAEIRLLTGFVMQEQVLVSGIDLGYITITSEDDEVTINRADLTIPYGHVPEIGSDIVDVAYPAFAGVDNATLPVIDTLFYMANTGGGLNRHGIYLVNRSSVFVKPYKGIKNASGIGLGLYHSSEAVAIKANFDDASTTALQILRSSHCSFREGTAQRSGYHGTYVGSASTLDALGANFDGAGANGVFIYGTSRVNFKGGSSASGCGENGVHVSEGSLLDLYSAGNLDNNGIYGLFVDGASVVEGGGAGISISGNVSHGVQIRGASVVNLPNASINGNGKNGVIAMRGANVNVGNATIRDNTEDGLYGENGSIINADNAICTNNGGYGAYANRGSKISVVGADCSLNLSATNYDIVVNRGSTISANESNGAFQLTPNQLYSAGCIFK